MTTAGVYRIIVLAFYRHHCSSAREQWFAGILVIIILFSAYARTYATKIIGASHMHCIR